MFFVRAVGAADEVNDVHGAAALDTYDRLYFVGFLNVSTFPAAIMSPS